MPPVVLCHLRATVVAARPKETPMRHTCEHCHTVYSIPDHKVAGRFVKVRCQSCRGTMHVVGLNTAGTQRAEQWWCAWKGQPKGPFSREEVLLFVDLGEVSARTRMWRSGMPGWQRVCESTTLSWVYARVVERLSEEELLLARSPTRSYDPFENAALLSDGQGWFPDPTLKSGIILLDDATQAQLAHLAAKGSLFGTDAACAQRGVFANPTLTSWTSWTSWAAAAAAGLAVAVGSYAWLTTNH